MTLAAVMCGREALIALYDATGGHSWKVKTGWELLHFSDYCGSDTHSAWFGVYCSSGEVVLVTLPENNLVGSIPDELSQLTALVSLDLRGNKLSGALPSSLFTLSQLSTLLLNTNSLDGTLPSNFAGVASLVSVDVSFNSFVGALPPISCPKLCSLKQLIVSNNKLSGPIPDTFTALPFLELVDLSHNKFTGPIPATLPHISDLGTVKLDNNSLTGTLPAAFAGASLLATLSVADNKLFGQLPDLSALADLTLFDGSANAFNGSVPSWAGCSHDMVCHLEGNPRLTCQTACEGNHCHVDSCTSCVLTYCSSSNECLDAGGGCPVCDLDSHRCVPVAADPPPPPPVAPGPTPPPPIVPITSATFTSFSSTSATATGSSNATSHSPPPPAYGAIIGVVVAVVCCVGVVVAVAIVRVRRSSAVTPETVGLLAAARHGRRQGMHSVNESGSGFYYVVDGAAEESTSDGRISGGSDGSFRTAKDRTKELSVRFDTASSGKRGEVFTFVIDTRLEVIKWSELEITGEIGRGGYGTVLRARRGHTEVAVKVLRDIVHPEQVQAFVEEASILSDLKHPNCVLLMGVCVEPHHMSIVTEYMRGGDLHSVIYPHDDSLHGSPSASNLTRRRRFQILYEVALGLEYLHARGIAHRDIKPRNVLLDDRAPATAKLADFGLAGLKKMDIGGGGTELYSAPEVLDGLTADKRSDMYSFGIVMFEVLYSRKPTGSSRSSALDGNSVSIPEDSSPRVASPRLGLSRDQVDSPRLATSDIEARLPLSYVPLTQLTRLGDTLIYGAAFVGLGMMVGTLGPSLYLLSAAWGDASSPSALGMLFLARMVGTVMGTVLGVRVLVILSNQANKALTLATSVIALALLLIPYWNAEGLVHALFVLRGAGVGLVDTVGTGLVMYLWEKASSRALHTMSLAFGLGAVVSPLVIAATWSADAPDTPYWIMAVMILPLAVVALLLRSPPQFATPSGAFALGSRLPRHYLRLTALGEWLADPSQPSLAHYAASRNVRVGALLCTLYAMVVGAELAFGSWLPTFAMRAGIGSFSSAPFYGLMGYAAGATFAVFLLIACKPSESAPLSASTLWAGVVILGLAMSGLSPTLLSLFHLFDVAVTRSTVNALVITAWIGELVVPYILGHVHDAFEAGLHSAMLILFLAILILVVVLFRSFDVITPSYGWGAVNRRSYTARPDIGVGVTLDLISPSPTDAPLMLPSDDESTSESVIDSPPRRTTNLLAPVDEPATSAGSSSPSLPSRVSTADALATIPATVAEPPLTTDVSDDGVGAVAALVSIRKELSDL
ncbi:TKL protein kinase [Thecamonas trahens ATCC 50062]|uniref:TKL protein kinase n=1 Tax=Thecamonas trahens ATCC 50062 TaxID=461836 RepID=A0A0L0DFM4_THETB|nr:TKL protein kinase [Thecamonas trahens ATCC 50062]KNC51117.1 TKL protein kinase [Thecamonas trahens ATCC 50062]|eukprot:XP_013756325.1 TKL protein kinase [Thecamonas trahens ATCC 50062]